MKNVKILLMQFYRLYKILQRAALLLLPVMPSTCCFAQAISIAGITNNFDDYRRHHLQEKIFVHTDKDHYLAGEIMWFKIYEADASFHKPTGISTVAYLELLDSDNRPVIQEKVALKNGAGNGSVNIGQQMKEGNYLLRCYTNWMKNSAASFYFQKTITVINGQYAAVKPVTAASRNIGIHFFPEGGNLVDGIEAKVAFHVADNYGKGINCSGLIKDEQNNEIVKIQTEKFGIGNFVFIPQLGHVYTAQVNFSDGTFKTSDLPGILPGGYTLHVEPVNHTSHIVIKASPSLTAKNPNVYLFAHCRQSVKKALSLQLHDAETSIDINDNELGEGVNHLTLFNSEGNPVCERLVFVYPKKLPELIISPVKTSYKTRELVTLNAGTDAAAISDLSLAVYKVDSLQALQENFITDHLLLSADIDKHIESAGWYFSRQTAQVLRAMDNLMLTNGWRRFTWNDILQPNNNEPANLPEMDGPIISGKMVSNSGRIAPGIDGYLTIPSVNYLFRSSQSDSLGNIDFLAKNIYGTSSVILQTAPGDSAYHIEINKPFSTALGGEALQEPALPLTAPQTLQEQFIAMQVRQAYTGKFINRYRLPAVDTIPFYNAANQSYLLDNYTRFTTMEEIFREYVPYVMVKKHNGHFSLPVYNDAQGAGTFEQQPLMYVDGLPIFSADKLIAYNPLKLKKLDIITRKYFYSRSVFDGIIAFTSYEGNLDGFEFDPRTIVIDYELLQQQREFYSPVYDTEEKLLSHTPDHRYLLYWDPGISLEKYGNKKISFYSADIKGKFAAVIQGLTADGQPCRSFTEFEVE